MYGLRGRERKILVDFYFKNDVLFFFSKKHSITEERQGYKVFMTLIIHNILRRDIGTYTCVATNSLGKVNGTIRLYGKLY